MRKAVALLALCAVGACTSSGSIFNRASRQEGPDSLIESSIDTAGLGVYLETMQRLVSGDSPTQAGTFDAIEESAAYAPTARNRLLYALALSVPGHPGSDPAAGAERLRALIAAGDTLRPEERMLAQVLLQTADRLDVLQTAADASDERLASRLAAREAELSAEHEAELGKALEENEQLKRQLQDATAMLDAITNIERSISERESQ